MYTVSGKKGATLFSTISPAILSYFYNSCTTENRNEHSTIACNLLTQLLDDIITVTRHKSR